MKNNFILWIFIILMIIYNLINYKYTKSLANLTISNYNSIIYLLEKSKDNK